MLLRRESNNIVLDLENTIFAEDFFEEFYQIQKDLENTKSNIILDISNGVWFDMMCLSNLFLTLIKSKEENNNKVDFIIFNEYSKTEQEHIRLINYLKSCGIFEVIKEHFDENFNMDEVDNILIYNKEFLIKTEFQLNECIIPLLIIKDQNYISNNSDYFHKKLQLTIGNDLPKYDFDMLYNKFIFFLQETIENAFEHAYDSTKKKYCSIMVRKNNNYKFNSDISIKRNYNGKFCNNDYSVGKGYYQKHIEKKSPYWNRSKTDKSAYIEVFVSDIGKGLMKSFGEMDTHKDRNIIENIFTRGERSNKKAKTSVAGGLFMIYNLLAESNDSISIKSDINWSNFKCSDLVKVEEYCSYISNKGLDSSKISHGFSIVGYIGINSFDDYIKQDFLDFNVQKGNKIKNKIKFLLEDDFEGPKLSKVNKIAKVLDNRIANHDIKIFLDDFKDTDILILLPAKHMSIKSIQKLNIYVNEINQKKNVIKNFIIADIPDNEVNKYYNIYNENELNITNLVLISQSIRVARFCKSGKMLEYSKELTQEYVKYQPSSKSLCVSLKKFCSWIRKYDSYLIWNYIAEYQKQTGRTVFINDVINWNGLDLEKYLDFSQVVTIPKCNKLCLYQIFRLFDNEEKIYFHSAERFTDQLCEQVNKLGNLSNKNIHIKVGSVYVTGASANLSTINDEDYIVYFFNHGNGDNIILSFFEWASKEKWVDNKFGVNTAKNYKRIGRTPFIATNGNEFFMERHYDNLKEVFAIDTASMYNLIQDDSALSSTSISQIGHFDIDGEHDFLLVDVISIIKKAKIQSAKNPVVYNNAWDFIFCELYYSIVGHKKATLKSIRENINKELTYSENLVRKLYEYGSKFKSGGKNNQTGIIVYLNDFKSSYIIEEMKNMFSIDIRNRFFSIPTLIKGRESTSLLISPLLISTIENYISNLNENVTTTIFSAVTTSTRSRKEIKHIMYKLGSANVQTLSVIDRQRFTLGVYNSQSHKAFMRLDLPQLGSENSCMLCSGLKKIKELKEIINSEYIRQRIDEIISQWNVVKYSDNHYGIGIKIKKEVYNDNVIERIKNICEKCKINRINIDSNIGLVMFIIENIVVSISTDLLNNCLSDNSLDDNIKMLILSSYLMYFNSNEITADSRNDYCKKLYELLSSQKECNNFTSLVLIVLLANDYNLSIFNDIFISEKSRNNLCIDDLIFQLFLYEKLGLIDDNKYNYYDRYLKHKSEITKTLYGINLYTNKFGKHNHSRSLIRLYTEGTSFDENDYNDALNAAEYLLFQYGCLPLTLYKDTQEFSICIGNTKNKLTELKNSIKQAMNDDSIAWIPEYVSKATNDFFYEAEKINDLVLCKTDCEIIEKKLHQICEDAKIYLNKADNQNIKIVQKSCDTPHWFYFYNDIIEEIKYLIGDFRHSSDHLINPYSEPKDLNEYIGLIRVVFNEKFIEFKFYNTIDDNININDIKSIKQNKVYRPTMLDFELFDNILGPEQNVLKYDIIDSKDFFEKRTLCVTLSIPYVDIQ